MTENNTKTTVKDSQVKVNLPKKATEITTKSVVVTATIKQVVDKFLALPSTTFIQIWQKTEPKMNKTANRFYGLVNKYNCLNCVTNYNYQNMVNKARSKQAMAELKQAMIDADVSVEHIEAFFNQAKKDITENAETFQSAGLRWGEYVGDSKCIIENTPKSGVFKDTFGYYIQVAVMNYSIPVYTWKDTGKELTADEVTEMKTFIPPKKEGERQGLVKPYIIRSPRFETIESVSLNKVNYRLINS